MSKRINNSGPALAICLDNSEPIDPPAPVTKTTFPFKELTISSLFTFISSLSSKSLISTSLNLVTTSPLYNWNKPGTVCNLQPVSLQIFKISLLSL